MSQGFVYILINPAFIDQVKIGLTTDTAEERAKQLSAVAGVPLPFIVVFDVLVSDCAAVERKLHAHFDAYRSNKNREFFRVPIKTAIKTLLEFASEYSVDKSDIRSEKELLPQLKQLHPDCIDPDIISVKLIHLNDVCYLEEVRRLLTTSNDQLVERTDLGFMTDETRPLFSPQTPISRNVEIFLTLDPYSIINCTNLFTKKASLRIAKEYETKYPFGDHVQEH